MSVKEFFAFANIKQTVIEYLKCKADFEALASRNKKPFRAHISKHSTQNNDDDFFISDGFNSIKCEFSNECQEQFEQRYPSSIKVFNILNMLICVYKYQLILKKSKVISTSQNIAQGSQHGNFGTANDRKFLTRDYDKYEVVLKIDDLRVISFDRFQLKMPSSVQFDDQVRVHLDYVKHYLTKKVLLEESKRSDTQYKMPNISSICKNTYINQNMSGSNMNSNSLFQSNKYNQTVQGFSRQQNQTNKQQLRNQNNYSDDCQNDQMMIDRQDLSAHASDGQLASKTSLQQQSLMTIEMRNGDESADRKQMEQQRRKRKFRGLKHPQPQTAIDTCFLSFSSEDLTHNKELIDNLVFSDEEQKNIESSRNQAKIVKQQKLAIVEENLDELDDIMEGLIAEGGSDDDAQDSINDNTIMLSQQVMINKVENPEVIEDQTLNNQQCKLDSIDDILGEAQQKSKSQSPDCEKDESKTKVDSQPKDTIDSKHTEDKEATIKVKQATQESKKSLNSSSSNALQNAATKEKSINKFEIQMQEKPLPNPKRAIENDKIRQKEAQKEEQNRVELNFEITEEQEKQQKYNSFGQAGELIGQSMLAHKNQKELIENRKKQQAFQGQGAQGSQLMPMNSQVDLLDALKSGNDKKQSSTISSGQGIFKDRTVVRVPPVTRGKKSNQPVAHGQQNLTDFFIKKRETKQKDKQTTKQSTLQLKTVKKGVEQSADINQQSKGSSMD